MHKRDELQLEAQALREAHQYEQQAEQSAHEHQQMIHELRRQADEQPDARRLLWKQQLFQWGSYKVEIHELQTELLNMREKSEMKAHMSANMCKIDQTVPSRTVESEPENVLNTLSPGRSARWILPHELETPNRPTPSGLQSPIGAPVQFGPSPMTQDYSALPPGSVPPVQWGDVYGRAGDDGCELFGAMPEEEEPEVLPQLQQVVQHPDELNDADFLHNPPALEPLVAARCVNGTLVRPGNAEEELPSTACRQSAVSAPGGVPLGRGVPGQHQSPGGLTRPQSSSSTATASTATPSSSSATCQRSSKHSYLSDAVDTFAYEAKGSRRRRRRSTRTGSPNGGGSSSPGNG